MLWIVNLTFTLHIQVKKLKNWVCCLQVLSKWFDLQVEGPHEHMSTLFWQYVHLRARKKVL